jgi:hypothetical protein
MIMLMDSSGYVIECLQRIATQISLSIRMYSDSDPMPFNEMIYMQVHMYNVEAYSPKLFALSNGVSIFPVSIVLIT